MCVKWCSRPQGPLIRMCGVSIDAYFHGGFNETIGGRVRHWRPELCCFLTAAALLARTCVITLDCTHWPLHLGGRGVIRSGRHLTAAAFSSRSDVIRIVFSLLMSPSLVCWIGPTAVRKKVARVPLGRGLKGQCLEIFDFRFSTWMSVSHASDYTIRVNSSFFFFFAEIFTAQGVPPV
jgi:hypothetical protein